MYNHYKDDPVLQAKVKHRWDFLSTQCTGFSYMLTPKYAAQGFYIDDDKIDIFTHVNELVSARCPGMGEQAEREMANFVSKMATLSGTRKDSVFKLSAKEYWNIFGLDEYPALYPCAKVVNEMICSSAASERVWSIFGFIHSRLRNRLSNEKVGKLAFLYVNCAILVCHHI